MPGPEGLGNFQVLIATANRADSLARRLEHSAKQNFEKPTNYHTMPVRELARNVTSDSGYDDPQEPHFVVLSGGAPDTSVAVRYAYTKPLGGDGKSLMLAAKACDNVTQDRYGRPSCVDAEYDLASIPAFELLPPVRIDVSAMNEERVAVKNTNGRTVYNEMHLSFPSSIYVTDVNSDHCPDLFIHMGGYNAQTRGPLTDMGGLLLVNLHGEGCRPMSTHDMPHWAVLYNGHREGDARAVESDYVQVRDRTDIVDHAAVSQ